MGLGGGILRDSGAYLLCVVYKPPCGPEIEYNRDPAAVGQRSRETAQ